MIKKAVILSGGMGTRISEETHLRPKPMIEVGDRPILWHIMKIYSHYNINEFIICLGYKGYIIKEYFANYHLHNSDITFDLQHNSVEIHDSKAEPWKITLVNTGEDSGTGGRLRHIKSFVKDEPFCMTYGDGVADINISALIQHHIESEKLATITAVRPPSRYGATKIEDDLVVGFQEKPPNEGGYINGGFFVLSPKVLDYIDNDKMAWEAYPLETLAKNKQLSAYIHQGFWHPMDTLRDKKKLESLWLDKKAPWKIWEK